MKKIFAIMILAMFIISAVPMVLADSDDAGSDDKPLEKQLRPQLEKPLEKVKGKTALQRLKAVPERIKKAQEKREEFKERYVEAREAHKKQNEELTKTRERAKCQEDTEDCKDSKRDVKKGVKKRLENTLHVIDRSLDKLNNRVEESHVLTDAQKDTTSTEIANLQKTVEAQVEKVTAMADDATAEELREAIKETKKVWQDTSKLQKRIVARMTSSKLDNLVEKHTEFSNGMESRIADLKEQGIDTTELEALLAKFVDQTETLEANQKKSKELHTDAVLAKGELTQWRESQKLVRENLQDTKDTLRKFMKMYRDLKEDADDVEDDKESDENETEDEDESEDDNDELEKPTTPLEE
jgi:hypothetical protein